MQTAAVRFTFEGCELDLGRYELRRDGDVVAVEPQVFDVLVHLVRHRDRVVTKEELLDEVWGDRFVSESALTSRIKAARRAIGDDGPRSGSIRTVHGRGYRFVAERRGDGTGTDDAGRDRRRPAEQQHPVLHDAGRRAARLRHGRARATAREGRQLAHPPRLRLGEPGLAALVARPVGRHRLVRYDERGCGLSDWDVDDFSLDTWVGDLETVVDAAGLDRFPLLGISQGGPVAITYAARHPERVPRPDPLRHVRRGSPDPRPHGSRPGRGPTRSCSWCASVGATTRRPSARCSRRSSCPRARSSSGRRSTSCSG